MRQIEPAVIDDAMLRAAVRAQVFFTFEIFQKVTKKKLNISKRLIRDHRVRPGKSSPKKAFHMVK